MPEYPLSESSSAALQTQRSLFSYVSVFLISASDVEILIKTRSKEQ
jgi:hypothetical protein